MEDQNKRKLKNYLINRDLQLSIIVHNLLFMVIIILTAIGVVLLPLIRDMTLTDNIDVKYRAAQSFLVIAKRLIPALLILLVPYMAHLLLVTHRICGPVVNFGHTFSRLSEGDLTRKVSVRRRDFFKNESEGINAMIDGVSKIVCRVIVDQENLVSELDDIIARADTLDSQEKVKSSLKRLKKQADRVSEGLTHFRVEDTVALLDHDEQG